MKYALCTGINYVGTGSELAGCINDANDWSLLLGQRGFDVATLLEENATKAGIMSNLEHLIGKLTKNDILVFTFSGHGSWVPDDSGDEDDDRDEVLCPYDIEQGIWITDDEIAAVLTHVRDASVVMISDSCHSGTVSKLSTHYQPGLYPRKVRFLPPAAFMPSRKGVGAGDKVSDVRGIGLRALPGLTMKAVRSKGVLLMGGCRDLEFSYDAWFGERANGAFTRAAIDALGELGTGVGDKGTTYRDWYKGIRARLPSQEYPQSPTLYSAGYMKKWKVFAE